MANGQVREIQSRAHPRVHSRSRPSRVHLPPTQANSGIVTIAELIASIVSFIPSLIAKLCPHWISMWFHWCPTSPQALELAEDDVLHYLKRPYSVNYVNIGPCWGKEDNFIWTLAMNPSKPRRKTPLVLIHGFASGIGLWVMNLDGLSSSRPVYAFDMLGFGRSSRPVFSTDPLEAECQFVISVENWRRALGLEKFILLSHSLGGFIAAAYALRYPEHVAHLILANPWGFPERPIPVQHQYDLPAWVDFTSAFFNSFSPLTALRVAGPAGPMLVYRFRGDLQKKFEKVVTNRRAITNYIYHCNALNPSAETAFHAMALTSGWAKHPMITRINDLDQSVSMTFVYGSRSWVIRQPGLQIKYSRLNSFVDVQVIEGAGHHVYADRPEQFNALVFRICERWGSVEDSDRDVPWA